MAKSPLDQKTTNMHKCIISILILFSIPAFAKHQAIDSLHQLVIDAEIQSQLIRMDLYKQLCEKYRTINADTSLHYGRLALELAKKKENLTLQREILLTMGVVDWDQVNLTESEELLNIAFNSQQKEAENSLLKQEKERQMMLLNQRTRIAITTSLALLFLIIGAILLYKARQRANSMSVLLERKVSKRTAELRNTNIRLMLSNEELKRFAFIASHDLKEPLRNMGGFISLMKRRIRKQDYESLPEYLEFVEKSNLQMVDLVENVLEFSKMESNEKAKKGKVNLQEVITGLNNLFSNAEQKVEITYEKLPTIYASSSLIKIVLKNLIENAIKYNESETPQVQIFHKVEGDQFELHVKDNGIGIDTQYHRKIFGMFVRLHDRGAYRGTGMGLAFTKKLLLNNDGDIRVESEEGKGSTFIVSLTANVLPDLTPNDANQRDGTTVFKGNESPRRATQ